MKPMSFLLLVILNPLKDNV